MTAVPTSPAKLDVAAIVARQREHAPRMAATTAAERRERLRRLGAGIAARRDEIVAALRADLSRPATETELVEIHSSLSEIEYAARRVGRWMRPRRARAPLLMFGTSSRIVYEPHGVVLIMAPWNYPLGLLVNPLIAAIAAGNCAVLKPSEKAPATSALLRGLVAATFDPAEVTLVEGGPDLARALLEQPFDHICFTGSTALGRIVMAAAARHLASVTLELGGKSPAVVDASADPAVAAQRIAYGRFMNAGQTCIAPDYALVHESLAAPFLAGLRANVAAFYGASEEDRRASPDYARIVDAGHFARLRDLVERSVAAGAKVAIGGRFEPADRYVAPTVLTDVTPDMPVMADEIFGPILPVLTYRTTAEACRMIRSGGKPLSMYVFARDPGAADELVRGTSAGATVINSIGMHYFHHGLPFGGVGTSGLGAYHGEHGFRTFSHARPVVRQHEPALLPFFFPPYRGRLNALARRFLRILE